MWPFSKRLEDVLYRTKTVRVHGVKFEIKKIDPLAYADGSKAMLQEYEIYKVKKDVDQSGEVTAKVLEKTKSHYRDVFMASVVNPKLKRKDDGEGIPVDHLFTEMNLANELYGEIIEYSYGKKNLIQSK